MDEKKTNATEAWVEDLLRSIEAGSWACVTAPNGWTYHTNIAALAHQAADRIVALQQRVEALEQLRNSITHNGALLPAHFVAWAGAVRYRYGYSGSFLEVHLRELAEALVAIQEQGEGW